MSLVENTAEAIANRTRPNTYHWTIFKASIFGPSLSLQLDEALQIARDRLSTNYNPAGECYKVLNDAISAADKLVYDLNATAKDILVAKSNLENATLAYVRDEVFKMIGDSITVIDEKVENGEIILSSAPNWIEGSYNEEAYEFLTDATYVVLCDYYSSLAAIDEYAENVYAALDAFWASKVTSVKSLPFRVCTPEDALPGVNSNNVWRWESPVYYLSEAVDTIRLTIFKTKSNRFFSGSDKPFVCLYELELYDIFGNEIPLTEESFITNSMKQCDCYGLYALCDNDKSGKNSYHSLWAPDGSGYDGSEYVYL